MAEQDTTITLYEQQIQNPHPPAPSLPKLEVECTPDQTFLATQAESLDRYRAEDEAAKKAREARRVASGTGGPTSSSNDETGARAMAEHVGPVQFNMGGIQYDADEVIRRLKVRSPLPNLSPILLLQQYTDVIKSRIAISQQQHKRVQVASLHHLVPNHLPRAMLKTAVKIYPRKTWRPTLLV